MRPYPRAAGVTAGKTSTAGTVPRRAGGNAPRLSFGECAQLHAGTELSRLTANAPKGRECRRSFGSGKCAALAVTHISPKEAKSTHIEEGGASPAAGSPVAGPTCRTPATSTHQTPFGSQSRPWETRKRRSSDRSLRSTLAICSGGIGFRSLANRVAAEHELAGLVSFDYGQRHRKRLDSPALCGPNEQFYRSSTSAKLTSAFPAQR